MEIGLSIGPYRNLLAERIAEAKTAREAERRVIEDRQSTTIYFHYPKLDATKAIVEGRGPWVNAALIPRLQAEERRRKKREGEELVFCPEPLFDPEEL